MDKSNTTQTEHTHPLHVAAGEDQFGEHRGLGINAMPAKDPGLWEAHGMELIGPPLAVE